MRQAFSLVELLIVVIIIGVVYKLSLSNFQKIDKNVTKVTLQNLKEYLQGFSHDKSVKFLCLDNCKKCSVFVDGELQEDIKNDFDGFLDKTLRVYRYDFSFTLFELQKDIYFNQRGVEQDVCFSYEIDKKAIGEQVLVEFKNKVYDFTSPNLEVPIYNSLQEALSYKRDLYYKVIR